MFHMRKLSSQRLINWALATNFNIKYRKLRLCLVDYKQSYNYFWKIKKKQPEEERFYVKVPPSKLYYIHLQPWN